MGKIIHGHSRRDGGHKRIKSLEWGIYHAMKNRCLNKNTERYSDYGGRGISICDRWMNGVGEKTGFQCFLLDMGPRPSSKHSLDRIDNSKNYEPENCRWATRIQQARNARSNRIVSIYGEDLTLAEATERFSSVSAPAVRQRLSRGWDEIRAITAPFGASKYE